MSKYKIVIFNDPEWFCVVAELSKQHEIDSGPEPEEPVYELVGKMLPTYAKILRDALLARPEVDEVLVEPNDSRGVAILFDWEEKP